MNESVAGHDPLGLKRTTGKVRQLATGLGDEQPAGGHVPWSQRGLPEAVKTPDGDVGEIERGRSVPADRLRAQDEAPE